jgi:putative modified peptide
MATSYSALHATSLLDKLSSDDAFRAQFQKDPAAALASLGMPTALAECCKGKTLASKEVLAKSRDQITSLLTSKLALNVHNLCID